MNYVLIAIPANFKFQGDILKVTDAFLEYLKHNKTKDIRQNINRRIIACMLFKFSKKFNVRFS